MAEVIDRSELLIKPGMSFVKLHNDAVVLTRVVAPHHRIRWVLGQTEDSKVLAESLMHLLPECLPSVFPFGAFRQRVQGISSMFLKLFHKLLFQRWIVSDDLSKIWERRR